MSSFIDIMHAYFRGEKIEALCFILPVGLMLLLLAAAAFKAERGGFAWGVAVPAALFGIVLVGTGIGIGVRTAGQVAGIEKTYLDAPAAMVRQELPRMEKVNRNFRMTFYAFGALAVLGIAVHYLGGPGWGRGLGATLTLIAALGLLIDGFAERRAETYTAALEAIAIRHADRRTE